MAPSETSQASLASRPAEMRQSHEDSLALQFYPAPPSSEGSAAESQIWRAESTSSEPAAALPPAAAAKRGVTADHKLQSTASLPAELDAGGSGGAIAAHYYAAAQQQQLPRSSSQRSMESAPLAASPPQAEHAKRQGSLPAAGDLYGPRGRLHWASPAGRQRRARAESNGSLAATPPRRSFMKFPSAKDASPLRVSRATGEERA